MEDRRTFLKVMGATLASPMVLGSAGQVFGANERVQMGVIGVGTRGNQVYNAFMNNKDVNFIAACDVHQTHLDEFVKKNGADGKMAGVGDYRRILENKDIDAVLITTPDHWHGPILAEALSAGKHVYVEKPVSNTLAAGLKMVSDVRASKKVVQVGCQQRDWVHFQDWAKKVHAGEIGPINHCVLLYPGGGSFAEPQAEKPQTPPPYLNWEMFQGPAPRKPYTPSRLRWRSYWDYGGGAITDWGVHLTDVMLWYMQADSTAPLLSSCSAIYTSGQDANEVAPDTFSITWNYGKFVATLTNATPPGLEEGYPMPALYGNYFYGQKGVLLVNRYGWDLKPNTQRRGGLQTVPLKPEHDMDPRLMGENPEGKGGSATVHHTRNFLDGIKTGAKLSCPIEVGFNSTLPTLLAIESLKRKKTVTWDGKQAGIA